MWFYQGWKCVNNYNARPVLIDSNQLGQTTLAFSTEMCFVDNNFSSAYAEVGAGSFVGDIEGIFHLKLIIHVLV